MALEAAVNAVRVEHHAVRATGTAFARAIEANSGVISGDLLRAVEAWDALAKALAGTLQQLEEEIIDRVQVLYAQQRLHPGVLGRVQPRFEVLSGELTEHVATLERLGEGRDAFPVGIRPALDGFCAALRSAAAHHRDRLRPSLELFLQTCVRA